MSMKLKIYFLTTSLVIITAIVLLALSVHSIWSHIEEEKFQEVSSLALLLDKNIEGTYEDLVKINGENGVTIEALNKELQPFIDKLTDAYPGYGTGYYVKELNSIVAFGPDFKKEGLIDISPDSLARNVYKTKEPYQFQNYSQTRDGVVLANIRPIIRDGEVIGHTWGNVLVEDMNSLFVKELKKGIGILIVILVIGLIGSHVITRQYIKNLKDFRKRVKSLDLNQQQAPKFGADLMEVYNDVVSSHVALVESEQRFRDVANAFEEFIWETDLNGNYIYLSERATHILGYEPHELIGRNTVDAVIKEDQEFIRKTLEKHSKEKTGFRNLEYRKITKDGELIYLSTNCVPIFNSEQEVIGFRGAARDISTKKKHEQQIQYLAHYDYLTNLPNRSSLAQAISELIKENKPFALLFVDVDHFKTINDSLGHTMGDDLLKHIGKRLTDSISSSDQVYRFGGDEFIIVMKNFEHINEIKNRTLKIVDYMAQPIFINNQQLFTSISIGISKFPTHGIDYESLIKNADMAMYTAKENGRKQFIIYADEFGENVNEKFELTNNLYDALNKEQFLLNYQPQVDLHSGKIVGVEALIRWQHPTKGMISPAKFIPLAEETGLINPLGLWILRRACLDRKQWLDAGIQDIRVAVNISIKQFQQDNFVETVLDILEETGLDPTYLELEITEGIAMNKHQDVIKKLTLLKEKLIYVSIDDFGTGYSSLSYLKELPINQLKVDQSFVQGICDGNYQILQSIITLAQAMQLNVVAEGVETKEQAEMLKEFKCSIAQGYLYYKPMPAEDLLAVLNPYNLTC
ncbi:PAS domain S-box-containing protein/diguanylate cyclase (GGDEF)-like protein [Ureibacillus xyleni]|uniref:PAS domain S-box-containing protein/diguanylate cyclase (GGDEF)-like protein n=1 Tax=Ureibacillus xyleni TaxID=614648 RepID=A0A285TLE8_9BACL|nr:EAL domain-containing protein [Ureibacillus xyleni]SOC22774.1 PAS domain S-box-containing protein/diguanylate cyclase (GGDEF)-like protein [Ureibacillus xyleni]